jgi:hypothetical protein
MPVTDMLPVHASAWHIYAYEHTWLSLPAEHPAHALLQSHMSQLRVCMFSLWKLAYM